MKKERVQKQKQSHKRTLDETPKTDVVDKAALEAEMDDILADIDSVLEQNAQEFVDQFIQKGGE